MCARMMERTVGGAQEGVGGALWEGVRLCGHPQRGGRAQDTEIILSRPGPRGPGKVTEGLCSPAFLVTPSPSPHKRHQGVLQAWSPAQFCQLLPAPAMRLWSRSAPLISSGALAELFNPRGPLVLGYQVRTIVNLLCHLQRVRVRIQSEHEWEELSGRTIAN